MCGGITGEGNFAGKIRPWFAQVRPGSPGSTGSVFTPLSLSPSLFDLLSSLGLLLWVRLNRFPFSLLSLL